MTWVTVDRSRETPNGCAADLLDDVDGPICPGDVVNVRERATGDIGAALVQSIDDRWVYLSLAWNTLWNPRKATDLAVQIARSRVGTGGD